MLTTAENEMLTRVGPGTPCGELMRRYWHPVAVMAQLADDPVRKVRILGEDLVLFQDRSGHLGLIGPRCPHRAWKYIEDDVDRYCPDRELILKLYEEADRLMLQRAQARP